MKNLEHNKQLIQMLKEELEKSLAKEKNLIAQNAELIEAANTRMARKALGDDEDKLDIAEDQASTSYVRSLEEELRQLKELTEDANRLIEEFNDEKHEIKSRFKHLMQVLDDPSILPEEESSYKEDEEIDLTECFDRFEKEILAQKRRLDDKVQMLEGECAQAKESLAAKDLDVRAQVETFHRLNTEIEELRARFEANDSEMRRQLGNAASKVLKYKAKVAEL